MKTTLQGLKVLIIDDDLLSLGAFYFALSDENAEIRSAGSVDQALQIITEWVPQVVISDIGMPSRDGLSFMRELRKTYSPNEIPAIALTGYSSRDSEQIKAAGYQLVLSKPVNPKDLVSALLELAE